MSSVKTERDESISQREANSRSCHGSKRFQFPCLPPEPITPTPTPQGGGLLEWHVKARSPPHVPPFRATAYTYIYIFTYIFLFYISVCIYILYVYNITANPTTQGGGLLEWHVKARSPPHAGHVPLARASTADGRRATTSAPSSPHHFGAGAPPLPTLSAHTFCLKPTPNCRNCKCKPRCRFQDAPPPPARGRGGRASALLSALQSAAVRAFSRRLLTRGRSPSGGQAQLPPPPRTILLRALVVCLRLITLDAPPPHPPPACGNPSSRRLLSPSGGQARLVRDNRLRAPEVCPRPIALQSQARPRLDPFRARSVRRPLVECPRPGGAEGGRREG